MVMVMVMVMVGRVVVVEEEVKKISCAFAGNLWLVPDQLSPAEPLILAPNRARGGRPRIRGALRQTLDLPRVGPVPCSALQNYST